MTRWLPGLLLLFGIHAVLTVQAQFDSSLMNIQLVDKSIDSSYIFRDPEAWTVRMYVVSKNQDFEVTNRDAGNNMLYDPNSKAGIGLGISYRDVALDLGVSISNKKNDPSNSTNSFDFLSGLITGQHIFGLTLQIYSGFFSSFIDGSSSETAPPVFRDDIRTMQLGMSYMYNFNYKKFSFNAPYVGTQIQKRSAGSPVAGVFASYFDLRADSAIVPIDLEDHFNENALFSEANVINVGPMGGYAYTLVLPENLFFSLTLVPGISFNVGDLKTEEYIKLGDPLTVSPKLISTMSAGYGGPDFYGMVTYTLDRTWINLGDKNFVNYNMSKFKILVGYRLPHKHKEKNTGWLEL